jgi:hypothetical protein
MSSKRRSKVYGLTLICGHCASNKNIIADWPTSPNIPCRMPVQLRSVYHSLFVVLLCCAEQHMDVQSFTFVPSANNCRSEHIHRMLLPDVAVTTEQHQGKYIGLILVNLLYTKCLAFFLFLLRLKITPNFELFPVCKYLKYMFESHILE